MLAGLLSLLLLAAMQLAFALHVHNTATAHVIEGARVGARADSTAERGAERTRELMASGMAGAAKNAQVSATRTAVGGMEVVEVTAELRLPVLGPFGPGGLMTVSGQAYAEDQ